MHLLVINIHNAISIAVEDSFKNSNKEKANSKVEVAFPKYEQDKDDQYISKGGTGEGLVKHLSTSIHNNRLVQTVSGGIN